MTRIVAVHGVGQQYGGADVMADLWLPALRSGVRLAGGPFIPNEDLACAFYGDEFRRKGTKAFGDPDLDAGDVEEGWEQDFLFEIWNEAAAVEEAVPGPEARTKVRTPRFVQRALDALSHSSFFAGLAERTLIFDLKQVARYMGDCEIRNRIQQRVVDCVSPDTRVMIGHSLGSVVAYEALCAHPEWPIQTLVTLGSPLGVRNLIFDRLEPPPRDGVGAWPPSIERWTNIADTGDVVALVKSLGLRFGERVVDEPVHNGARAHDVTPYLTARETGDAITAGLAT